ncbi:hypothetical protein [Xanthomonas graminis]|uniref:hypothetical protein n=1 Tax=Xanthomonas graminis TaxID=3390026 RepID=UPI00118741CB|nr:hypothetical protein [Xanthomonas translucens]UKE75819.1 DUF4288 domain-containing protein [Xanthomonas translucens pv. arrhenatheri]
MNYFIFHIYMVGLYSPDRDDAWEENLRIYQEESAELAYARASRDALADQVAYKTLDGYTISWKIHSISLAKELVSIGGGEEVFSRTLTNGEAQSLLKKID